jgi:hypothetical protein
MQVAEAVAVVVMLLQAPAAQEVAVTELLVQHLMDQLEQQIPEAVAVEQAPITIPHILILPVETAGQV